jgi:threonine/homoserine/homoserine lactone efflux protein
MTAVFLNGLGTGFALSIMLGTVFFCLVQNSIEHGFGSGFAIATGVILSDVLLILLSRFNTELLPQGGTMEMATRLGGAGLLFALGVNGMRPRTSERSSGSFGRNPFVLASKGFLLNIINPANYLNWLAISLMLTNVFHYEGERLWLYYGGALTGIYVTEVCIAFFASFLKERITPLILRRIDIGVAILFIVFAGVLVWPLIAGSLR